MPHEELIEDYGQSSPFYAWRRILFFFRRRSYMELVLMVASVILALMFIIFLGLYADNNSNGTSGRFGDAVPPELKEIEYNLTERASRIQHLETNISERTLNLNDMESNLTERASNLKEFESDLTERAIQLKALNANISERESKMGMFVSKCITKECLESVTEMIYDMDSGVDPCQNFYQHSCGNWALRNPLYRDEAQINVQLQQQYDNMGRLLHILNSPIQRYGPNSYERKTKHLFESCHQGYGDTPALPLDIGHLFINMLVDTFPDGVFIFGDELNETTWDLQTELKRVRGDFWTDALFDVSVQLDSQDTNKRMINTEDDADDLIAKTGLFVAKTGKSVVVATPTCGLH